ncbi:MAG: glycosyltransferase [Candidatus Muirbacterium halophilum]|nr:glycosyltransferase [Candidatus Muirbacterium halophilum]MCK9474288.1 glycosyltransferase [Candidatus Muirbacterium halophilum]
MKISVIIPTFNRANTFKKTLNSLLIQTTNSYEIIVVDESTNNEIFNIIKKIKIKTSINISFYKNPGKGQGNARNFGASVSKYAILLFIDSDVICSNILVEEHLKHHKYGEKAVLGNILFPVNKKIDFYTKNIDLGYYFSQINSDYVDFIKFITANISLNKNLFIKSGGFDKEFTSYGFEDLELGYRIFNNKKTIKFAKNAIGYHLNVRTLNEIKARNINIAKASLMFFKKHPEYFNPYLLPVQRIIHKNYVKIPKYSAKNFSKNLELEAENTVINELTTKVDFLSIKKIKKILKSKNLFFNSITLYEISYLSEFYNIKLKTSSNDLWAKFLFNYKFPIKKFSNTVLIDNNKEKTITYYNTLPNLKNYKDNYLPFFMLSIIKNRNRFYQYLISRIKNIKI